MGRSSKTESVNTDESNENTSSSNPAYQFSSAIPPASTGRAITESESMARDIKEGRLSGYVGNGTTLNGDTSFHTLLRVDGHLTGRIDSEEGTLVVGSTGKIDANVTVATAIINGTVNGDVVAAEKVELGRTARVVGNIQTARLLIQDGAILEGSCNMLKAKESLEKSISRPSSQLAASSNPQNKSDESDNSEDAEKSVKAATN